MSEAHDFIGRMLSAIGAGNYTMSDGTTVHTSDLPPDTRSLVDSYGAIRDLKREAGDIQGSGDDYQQMINQMYDPKTRAAVTRALMARRAFPR